MKTDITNRPQITTDMVRKLKSRKFKLRFVGFGELSIIQ